MHKATGLSFKTKVVLIIGAGAFILALTVGSWALMAYVVMIVGKWMEVL